MTLSREIRRLENNWNNGQFPKHLEFLELTNLRGWTGQRIEFKFPIVAIVGENGMGKSTIIQAAAALTAMTLPDHHDWNKSVADNIICGGFELWRAMCRTWVQEIY